MNNCTNCSMISSKDKIKAFWIFLPKTLILPWTQNAQQFPPKLQFYGFELTLENQLTTSSKKANVI